jgi:hypothetical protein
MPIALYALLSTVTQQGWGIQGKLFRHVSISGDASKGSPKCSHLII